MSSENGRSAGFRLPLLQGLLPLEPARVPAEVIAGLTLAALAIPEVMGYTRIAGTPVITGLYTMLIPMALFALFGSSRHLVVGADSATAAILAAGLVGLAATGTDEYLALLVATLLVLLVLLFLTGPLAYMPEAVLSAVVFLIGLELIDLKEMRRIFDQRRSEFWIALVTTAMVVFVGVEQGILLAIALSLVDHTRRGYRPKNALLVPNKTGGWRPKPVATLAQALPGLAIYRFTHSMYYANAQQLTEEVTQLVNHADPPLRWLCIDASAVDDVDYSSAQVLRELDATLREKGVHLVVAQVMEDLRETSRYHLAELFGEDAIYDSLADVETAFRQQAD